MSKDKGFDWETTAGVHWSEEEYDWMCGGPTQATRALLAHQLVNSDTFKNLVTELDKRGYDVKTLKLSVKKKKDKKKEKKVKGIKKEKELKNKKKK